MSSIDMTTLQENQSTVITRSLPLLLFTDTCETSSNIRYPTVEANFIQIRSLKLAYVDKTGHLEQMLNSIRICFFVTRPRRFGKSLFLQMIESFFHGDQNLFEGLKISDKGNAVFFKGYPNIPSSLLKSSKWLKCPVISLNFRRFINIHNYTTFLTQFQQMIENVAKKNGIEKDDYKSAGFTITTLIHKLHKTSQLPVVLLIDEYSYPIECALYQTKDKIPNREFGTQLQIFFDQFFSCIKAAIGSDKIRLVFITGVSKMGLNVLDLESGGSNIFQDLTNDGIFRTAFGFTEEEIRNNLIDPKVAQEFNLGDDKTKTGDKVELLMAELKKMYDGYNFTLKNGKSVYNPISTIECLRKKDLASHWCSTGSLDAIVKKLYFLKPNFRFDDSYQIVELEELEEHRNPVTEFIPVELQMLAYGYLTISDYNENTKVVYLKFPNQEVREALRKKYDTFVPRVDPDFMGILPDWKFGLQYFMMKGNVPGTMGCLMRVFDMPFSPTLFQGVDEQDIRRRLVSFLWLADIDAQNSVQVEDSVNIKKPSSEDYVDVLTVSLRVNFVISLRVDQSALDAIVFLHDCFTKQPEAFENAINYPQKAFFVGVNFEKSKGGKLTQWVNIPYENGKFQYENAEAFPSDLLANERFKKLKQ